MPARTLSEIRATLTGAEGEAFARGFADAYFAQALGVMPKSEIDLLVFRLLIDAGAIDPNGSIFALARALNVTPTKARGLLFQYQLRHIDESQADLMILGVLARARYSVDDKRLSFGVESPLARAAIDSRLKERGVFADISFSGEILRVPLSQFAEFVTVLMTEDKAKALEKELKAAGHLPKGGLGAFLTSFSVEAAKGAAGKVGEAGYASLMDGLSDFVGKGDVSMIETLAGLIG